MVRVGATDIVVNIIKTNSKVILSNHWHFIAAYMLSFEGRLTLKTPIRSKHDI